MDKWIKAAKLAASVFSVVGFFIGAEDNRETNDLLNEIRNNTSEFVKIREHFNKIDKDLADLKSGNRQILRKLDELPETIRKQTEEEVRKGSLREIYASLDKQKKVYFKRSTNRSDFKYNSKRWHDLEDNLAKATRIDNRLSKVYDLVIYYEFALLTTGYDQKAKDYVDGLCLEKINFLKGLQKDVEFSFNSRKNILEGELNTTTYVGYHNLDQIDSPTSLQFVMTTHELNSELDKARSKHVYTIKRLQGRVYDMWIHLGEISNLIDELEAYRSSLIG